MCKEIFCTSIKISLNFFSEISIESASAPVQVMAWSPVDSPHKHQWRGALMLSLIWAWTNGWANNRDTGDLGRHRAYYDVTVMYWLVARSQPHYLNQCYFALHDNDLKYVRRLYSPYPMKSRGTWRFKNAIRNLATWIADNVSGH